jgi:hypothetical protein
MRRALIIAAVMAVAGEALAEQDAAFLTEFNTERIHLNTWGMFVLLGWAAANIGVGTVGNFTTEGPTRYLHQGNAAWNLVNLAIAGLSLCGLYGEDPAALTAAGTLEKAHDMEWILWLNSGLDVAYIAAGGFLWERGLRNSSERLRGYGQALIIQGAFLLAFDLVLVALNTHHNRELMPHLFASTGEHGARVLGLALTW